MAKYCQKCGAEINDTDTFCASCGTSTSNADAKVIDNTTTQAKGKSKMAAGLLGIFLGSLGVHNFYLGYNGKAIAQLLITILTCGIGAIVTEVWGLIEGILILTGSIDTDANGNKLVD